MIPRMIPVPPESDLYKILPQAQWAAIAIAQLHLNEDIATGRETPCDCRCCLWARGEL